MSFKHQMNQLFIRILNKKMSTILIWILAVPFVAVYYSTATRIYRA